MAVVWAAGSLSMMHYFVLRVMLVPKGIKGNPKLFHREKKELKGRHGKTGSLGRGRGWVGMQVKQITSQKRVILSKLKISLGQSAYGSGQVDPYTTNHLM